MPRVVGTTIVIPVDLFVQPSRGYAEMPWPSCSEVLQRFRCFFGKGKVTATKIMPSGSIGDASFDNGPKSLQHGHRLRVRNGENFVEAPFDSKGVPL
ncbi:hypothetical protein CC1G_15295 [Coprinopsis cinerea okayama7|uniref:Uncharacterized protein n=1 Tax=Coprinopsis cinerea (strain Okayama-7 / 130 / ATCC MYA-4618 / FGSC 9003) TaxID=240176 RepID=D6RPX4_COPC7|nr:hypothetical protein CC1G_15295 [Coprinopsis cinerea okayama7\|eukprot:XP_002910388.1 hypothetical protein CC1G_15295 [Coprinopsis cinerea okayama7\